MAAATQVDVDSLDVWTHPDQERVGTSATVITFVRTVALRRARRASPRSRRARRCWSRRCRLLGRRQPRRVRRPDPGLRDPDRRGPRHPLRPVLRRGVLPRPGLAAPRVRRAGVHLPRRVHGRSTASCPWRSWPGRCAAPTTSTSSTGRCGCGTGPSPARPSTPRCSRCCCWSPAGCGWARAIATALLVMKTRLAGPAGTDRPARCPAR